MANPYVKPYLESSAFIAWIKGEIFQRDGSNCTKVVGHILNQAKAGEYPVFTSTWTLAEVHKRKKEISLDEKQSRRILEYFEHDYIYLVDITRAIGEQGHMLARQYGLKPTDSVHLACAIRAGCDVLLSYDPDFLDMPDKPKTIVIDYPKIIPKTPLPLYDNET